jgi:hypothetical protein
VHSAIREFDRLGRDTFLNTYGFGKARDYFLVQDGQLYDSKAIAGVAHQYLPGHAPLKADEFSGGEMPLPVGFVSSGSKLKVPMSSFQAYRRLTLVASTFAFMTLTAFMADSGRVEFQRQGRHR